MEKSLPDRRVDRCESGTGERDRLMCSRRGSARSLAASAITPDTALRLSRFFDNSPEFWLNLQQMHDLTKAKLALAKTIEAEVRVYQPAAA